MAKVYCTTIFSILFFSAVVTALEIDYYWKDYDGKAPNDAFVAVVTALEIDYYWKDYDGKAPNDAFVAVQTASSGATEAYIGQSSIVNVGTLPGHLLPYATSLTVTSAQRNQTTSSNLKILAIKDPCKLVWAKIHYDDIKVLKKLNFLRVVHGGEETKKEVYIGRRMHEGSVKVGKVYNIAPYQGLTLPKQDGTSTVGMLEFEILLYVPGCN